MINFLSIKCSSNILMDAHFTAKLGDFGFARPLLQLPEGKRFVLNCTPCGTDGYIAPDFLINKEMGQKSDIFSFGVVRNLLPCYLYKHFVIVCNVVLGDP